MSPARPSCCCRTSSAFVSATWGVRLRMTNCALGEGMALLRAGEVEFVLGASEPLEDYGLEYCEMLSYDIVLITSLAHTSSTTPLLLQQRKSAGYIAYPSIRSLRPR